MPRDPAGQGSAPAWPCHMNGCRTARVLQRSEWWCGVAAQPGLRLAAIGGFGVPGPSLGAAVAYVVADGSKAMGRRYVVGAPACRMPFRGVGGDLQPVAAQRETHRVVGEPDLLSDCADRAVLDHVAFLQIVADIGKAQPAEGGLPPGILLSFPRAGTLLPDRRGSGGVDVAEMT